jgi:hypothetical protein
VMVNNSTNIYYLLSEQSPLKNFFFSKQLVLRNSSFCIYWWNRWPSLL